MHKTAVIYWSGTGNTEAMACLLYTSIVASDKFSYSGVAVFALMAAGGDLGGAVGPQIVGSITDFTMKNNHIVSAANYLSMSAEQFGMKIGMVCAAVLDVYKRQPLLNKMKM